MKSIDQDNIKLKDKKSKNKAAAARENGFDALAQESENRTKAIEDQVVEELNQKHAVVSLDQFFVLTEKENPVFGGKDFSLESKQSFKNQYENKTVECSDGIRRSKADIWLKSPNRREFDGIVFNPASDESTCGYYNLWRGFNKTAKAGDCSKYWAHVKENICSNGPEAYRFVRKWVAYIFQHLAEVHTALVLVGGQGVGKNSFVEPLGVLLGIHYVLLSSISELVSNFNYHLKHAVLIHANEALWGGNRKELGALKAMITEKTGLIEGKGKDRIMVRNFKHVILSSNEDWPVHLDADDRRFYVLRVSEDHKGDHSYFAAIQEQLDNGGYEALLHDLLNEDLSDFNPRVFPNSEEAFAIKLRSADSSDRYIYNALLEGCFDVGNATPNAHWPDSILKDSAYTDYTAWCSRSGEKKVFAKDAFCQRLRKLIPAIKDWRPRVGDRQRHFALPMLENARLEFQNSYKTAEDIWEVV